MIHYWTTREGERIALKDMTTDHVENALRYLQKRIKSGDTTVIVTYGGMGWEGDDMWYDEEEVDRKKDMQRWVRRFSKELDRRYARLPL